MKSKTFRDLSIIAFSTLALTFLVWLPHLLTLSNFWGLNFSEGFNTIYRNYDGLEYVIIAKSLYNPEIIASLPQSLPASYFPAHFPGYSLALLIFSPFIGFLKSMLLISLFFTIASVIAFYFFTRDFKLTNHPVLLSFIFLVLPARWVITHSVGSSEPMFIFFIISFFYFLLKYELQKLSKYIWLAALMGLFAQITRPPGVLLIVGVGLYLIWKLVENHKLSPWLAKVNPALRKEKITILKIITNYYPLLLIPVGLLGIFTLYSIQLNDFWAYFHTGDNIHLTFPPYQVFNITQPWVGDIWLEDIVYIFIFGFLGGIYLFKQKLYPLAFFVLTYFVASTLVAHRDISRYVLPTFPFILIAFEKVLTSREFRIVLVIVALAIYFYSQNYILQNTAPYPNPQLFD